MRHIYDISRLRVKVVGKIVAFNNVDDLVKTLNNSHNPEGRKHFTELPKLNFKWCFAA